jgi:hypothetical protein
VGVAAVDVSSRPAAHALVEHASGTGGVVPRSLFVIGAAALALLLIGIHNAWDTVTHIVLSNAESDEQQT